MKVPFARPSCDGNELLYLREVLESGWLTTGRKTHEFEERFGRAVGAEHALAVNSCTSALHLACEASGIGPGSRVIVPTLTFTATAEVIHYLGGEVVLADIDPLTGLIDLASVARILNNDPDIDAIMPVHFAGRAVRMRGSEDTPGLLDLARTRKLKVIEDAAHAFPARYECGDNEPVGSLDGTTCCFSFYANKTITTGEGGMLTTHDAEIAERVRRMRLHGIDRDAWNRFTTNAAQWEYDVVAPGYKYNMPDIAAAIGLAQLERAEEFRACRQKVAEAYFQRLKGIPGLQLPSQPTHPERHSWHLFSVVLGQGASCERNQFIEALNERGIGTSVHYKPLHRLSHWKKSCPSEPGSFPGAEAWWRGCFSLPIFAAMTDDEINAVCQATCDVAGSPKFTPSAETVRS